MTHLQPRDRQPAPTLLVGVDFGLPNFDRELEELGLLAQTAGLEPVARLTCKRKAPDAALFVGSGKADEIKLMATQLGAVEVLFDQSLSPAQQRNLERHIELPVNDRTLLILEIFGQRARSHEGKLQVELARQQYLSTRLVRRWSHLERQSGGIGMRGGPVPPAACLHDFGPVARKSQGSGGSGRSRATQDVAQDCAAEPDSGFGQRELQPRPAELPSV